ncbi:MAG: NAD(P)H-dependent oxidoreductase [Ahrensia sp.]|nr:NAD(P)H-dependent oxidoreductase [Ahrensia sp.]
MTKIIIIPGSTRTGSHNVRLAVAIKQALEATDADITLVDLSDYPMPIYNGDLEQASGAPREARDLAALIALHQGVVLVNPEYNASITPLMKNTLDWLSRDMGDVKPYQNRAFALASCSPGALGGIRALNHMRDTLISIGAQEVISPQIGVGNAANAFDENGNLAVERSKNMLQTYCDRLIEAANRYA